ncbi:MAG: VWA domain-containing protein [Chloroflexi bacterium]|nr:VWA domain-containing protein [Chloroflexota bacterium]
MYPATIDTQRLWVIMECNAPALEKLMLNGYRYSRWDGTQKIFDIDEDQLMEELSNELLAHGDLQRALRNLLQRGMENGRGERMEGLRDLMERLKGRRQQDLERYNLDSMFDDINERLQSIVETERQGIDQRVQEARERAAATTDATSDSGMDAEQVQRLLKMLEERANRNRERLDNLPGSPGGVIRELSDYDFMDAEAQRQFQELLDMLKQSMLQNYLQSMKEQLQGLTPEDMAGLREMLGDLNQMLHDQAMGQEPDFQGFMDKYGALFGDNPPKDMEELLDQLTHQMAQMQSLLDSMSPEMRGELEGLLNSLLDEKTMSELAELAMNLEQLYPMEELRRDYPFMGDESLTMDQAMELMGSLQDMDELERQIQEAIRQGNIDNLDLDKVEELLGEDARRAVEELKRIVQMLEEAGYVKRKGEKLEITPRGIRKIGHKALREVFNQLKKDRFGRHEVYTRGTMGEQTGETKLYEFGDAFALDLQRTVMNAIKRSGPTVPVRLNPEDFEVQRTEHMTQAATCLLLDQSRSMGLYGSFQAAKKVAIALYTLIHSQFPRDRLYLIGLSDYAIELRGDELPELTWNSWVSGTNMHHAFSMSRKLLSKEKVNNKQILLITDGEPTAHMEGDRAYFAYPPSLRTIQETLKEVKRCTQDGITINTFMLESSSYLLDFVDKMTRINRGRAFYTTPGSLGKFVLVDYLTNRRKRLDG